MTDATGARTTRARLDRVRLAGAQLATLALLAGCAWRGVSGAPMLASLAPDTGDVHDGKVMVVIARGAGFDSLNTVHFGRIRLMSVPRLTDSTLQFTVPTDDTFLPDRGARPIVALADGRYDVVVETGRGKSNAVPFTLTGGMTR